MSALLSAVGVSKQFSRRGGPVTQALDEVSISIEGGSVAGLVGESGSGKSTLGRCIMGLERPDAGSFSYDGIDLLHPSKTERKRVQREIQMVFQDPYSSLNPRRTVENLVGEGLLIHDKHLTRAARRDRVVESLRLVGLGPESLPKYPRAFSGGQRQRIAIARALVMDPKVLVCDEPISALDVSVQAQVINLLKEAQRELSLTVLIIAHDLAVVRFLCDTVTVLEHGVVADQGPTTEVFERPRSEYTRNLLAAIPVPVPPRLRAAEMGVPNN